MSKSLPAIFFFQKMDRNKDGVVTIEEFIESCKKVWRKRGLSRPKEVVRNLNMLICILAQTEMRRLTPLSCALSMQLEPGAGKLSLA